MCRRPTWHNLIFQCLRAFTSFGSISPEASVNNECAIFAGTANRELAQTIARELGTRLGACVVD
jgi:hypothetical protein